MDCLISVASPLYYVSFGFIVAKSILLKGLDICSNIEHYIIGNRVTTRDVTLMSNVSFDVDRTQSFRKFEGKTVTF